MTDDSKKTLNALKATEDGQDYSAVLRALADYASAQGSEDLLEQATSELEKVMLENVNRVIPKVIEREQG